MERPGRVSQSHPRALRRDRLASFQCKFGRPCTANRIVFKFENAHGRSCQSGGTVRGRPDARSGRVPAWPGSGISRLTTPWRGPCRRTGRSGRHGNRHEPKSDTVGDGLSSAGSTDLIEHVSRAPQDGVHRPDLLNGLARGQPVLERIPVPLRGSRTDGAAMHPTAPLARHGRSPTGRAGPGLGAATSAVPHRTRVSPVLTHPVTLGATTGRHPAGDRPPAVR
jgi:hypothetical protein